uniref:COesterase domain-containing protein n=1 Tax=Parastrongyloides trichosuri TaxID=131310 RepID=A0A0N4Z5E9_PARTI
MFWHLNFCSIVYFVALVFLSEGTETSANDSSSDLSGSLTTSLYSKQSTSANSSQVNESLSTTNSLLHETTGNNITISQNLSTTDVSANVSSSFLCSSTNVVTATTASSESVETLSSSSSDVIGSTESVTATSETTTVKNNSSINVEYNNQSTTASSIKNDTSTATEQTTEVTTMSTTTTLIPMRVENYTYKCNMTFENNITVDEYLGIPYGKAPVGYLRFQPPVPVDPPTKESPYNASIPAATCPQDIFKTNISALDFWNPPDNISEDCLQLNMWVPANTTGAVLVNLCGGDYSRLGASNDIFNGSVLAAFSKAIVVNLNFRLGALGFASFTGTNVTGNMGLLDQQLGLKWVNDNIEQFGGNK